MLKFVAALILTAVVCSSASAQCPGGICLPGRPVQPRPQLIVVRPARPPVVIVRPAPRPLFVFGFCFGGRCR